MQNIPFHPVADIFPLIHGKEFVDLKQDIKNNGLHEPVVMYEKQILDGRNRFRACQETGVSPHFVDYGGNDPVGYVVSLNLHRRHLTSDQRAASAIEALPQYEIEAKKRQGERTDLGDNINQKIDESKINNKQASQQVAEVFGTNRQYVSDMKKIKNDDPDLFEEIKSGAKKLTHVKKDVKKKAREAEIATQTEEIEKLEIPAIEKKYHVISIDPPWPYEQGNKNSYDSDGRRAANPYPEMSIQEIANLEIPAQDNCVMWLWTTHKFLPDSFGLLKEWGFEYKATMVWDKQKIGLGHWLRMQCEFCLLAVKGDPLWDNTTVRDILSSARREHSRKPDEFFDMVEKICYGSKLEYFSREKREGWEQIGNDKDKF